MDDVMSGDAPSWRGSGFAIHAGDKKKKTTNDLASTHTFLEIRRGRRALDALRLVWSLVSSRSRTFTASSSGNSSFSPNESGFGA